MIYKQKIQIQSFNKIVELYVAPCIYCNCDDIKIEEYEDMYGFISTATCKKCKAVVRENVCDGDIIRLWNENNDIAFLVKSKTKLIEDTKIEIKALKLKAIQRSKKKK